LSFVFKVSEMIRNNRETAC